MHGTPRFVQTFASQLTCPADVVCGRFGLFISKGVNRCVQLDNHAGETLCKRVMNIARHPCTLLQYHGMAPLLAQFGLVSCNHHMESQCLGQFDLFTTICSSFHMLNTNKAAHVPE